MAELAPTSWVPALAFLFPDRHSSFTHSAPHSFIQSLIHQLFINYHALINCLLSPYLYHAWGLDTQADKNKPGKNPFWRRGGVSQAPNPTNKWQVTAETSGGTGDLPGGRGE